jgi:hypothetical protein
MAIAYKIQRLLLFLASVIPNRLADSESAANKNSLSHRIMTQFPIRLTRWTPSRRNAIVRPNLHQHIRRWVQWCATFGDECGNVRQFAFAMHILRLNPHIVGRIRFKLASGENNASLIGWHIIAEIGRQYSNIRVVFWNIFHSLSGKLGSGEM